MTIDEFDFKSQADKMFLAMQFLSSVDLEAIIRTIGIADAIGPFADPTAYRDALYKGDMHDAEKLARALVAPVEMFNKMLEARSIVLP